MHKTTQLSTFPPTGGSADPRQSLTKHPSSGPCTEAAELISLGTLRHENNKMSVLQLVTVLFLPSLYIVLACCALAQFSMIFNAISSLAFHMQRQPLLEPFAPLLKAFLKYLESIFGPAYKFIPNPTHVLLVALMVAYILHK